MELGSLGRRFSQKITVLQNILHDETMHIHARVGK